MPNKVKWTTEWPTEEGHYWFIGWCNQLDIDNEEQPDLISVTVHKEHQNTQYVSGEIELFKNDGSYGFWAKRVPPNNKVPPESPSLTRPTYT